MSIPADSIAQADVNSALAQTQKTAFPILALLAVSHFFNDLIQSLLPAIYPLLKESFDLSFGQIGLITLTFQFAASLLQPFVGVYTDRHPKPYSLVFGMGSTVVGLILLSQASTFPFLLLSAAMIGIGSSIFHPEASRVVRMASGGRYGLAQSLFLVGGNTGTAIGPLLAAFIVMARGQTSVAWFILGALFAIVLLARVGRWYAAHLPYVQKSRSRAADDVELSRKTIIISLLILGVLIFSKYFYLASLSSYYTFYLMHKFGIDAQNAQVHLFIFLGSVAAGTIIGGPVGDRIGRRLVIWVSILGVLPFSVLLPHANLFWTTVLTVIIGIILASAFAAILVYAQELVPGRTGLISGVFYGFAFGMGGLGAALLGQLADRVGIESVYAICAYLPAIGLLAWFLPTLDPRAKSIAGSSVAR